MKNEELERRDIELENIVGNLPIAEYQVEKLRARVVDSIVTGYSKYNDKKQSTHIFKKNGSWVKVSFGVEEMAIDKNKGIREGE